jgi:hypothetical protein
MVLMMKLLPMISSMLHYYLSFDSQQPMLLRMLHLMID